MAGCAKEAYVRGLFAIDTDGEDKRRNAARRRECLRRVREKCRGDSVEAYMMTAGDKIKQMLSI